MLRVRQLERAAETALGALQGLTHVVNESKPYQVIPTHVIEDKLASARQFAGRVNREATSFIRHVQRHQTTLRGQHR